MHNTLKYSRIRKCGLPALALFVLSFIQNAHAQTLDSNQFSINPNVYGEGDYGNSDRFTLLSDFVATFYQTNSVSFYGNGYENTAGAYAGYMEDSQLNMVPAAFGSVTAGDTYDVTWNGINYNTNSELGGSGVAVQWYDDSKNLLSTTDLVDFTTLSLPSTWTAENFNAVAPTGAAYVGIQWYSLESTGATAFQLTDVTPATPEPSSFALVISGMLLLFVLSRLQGQVTI